MPNIENLRKQAKLYLRWHRDRHYPVAEQIRAFSPRFRDMSDKDILQAAFTLRDAQELVARRHGFENWLALIKGTETMTVSEATTDHSVVLSAEPQLFVSDLERARVFYVEKLGFELAFSYGEPPFYAQVSRGGARLNLRHADGPVFDAGFRGREEDALSATIAVDGIKPLFLEFQRAAVTFHQNLRAEPWGARTFIVRDPDGNLIAFAG